MALDGTEAINYIEENNIPDCIVECGVSNGCKKNSVHYKTERIENYTKAYFHV